MGKEDIFSKFNVKDYNNQLENILEKKSFSAGAKNILLNILYKIEIAYEDYSKVKALTKTKREMLEEIINIIETKCFEIELIKPMLEKETKLKDKKWIAEKNEGKIISYPNEKTVFYAICNLGNDKYIINKKHKLIKEPMEKLLNSGYIMETEEIIRDFDGWSWNIAREEIENYIYNIVYQIIKILVEENYLNEYASNIGISDFIEKYEKRINSCISEEVANNIIILIYQISILESIKKIKNKKNELVKMEDELNCELKKMEDKKTYLQALANEKKAIGKEIKEIDEVINNNKLLKQKFLEKNKSLPEKEKIFSLSEFSEILQQRRKNLLDQLEQYSQIMKPMNYVKTKSDLKRKVEILSGINTKENIEKEENRLIIELQKNFLVAFTQKIKRIDNKKDLIKYMYLFRYYKLLPIDLNTQIKDVEELKEALIKTEKYLITRGCNIKAITILCQNIEKNYSIISEILSSNIIDLEEMNLEFKKQNDKFILNVYDDDMIENTIECELKEKLNVRLGKKIKLFL